MKNIFPVKADNLQMIDIEPGYSVIFCNFDHFMELDKKGLIPLFHNLTGKIDGITPLKKIKQELTSSIPPDIFDKLIDMLKEHGFIKFQESPLPESQAFNFRKFKNDALSPAPQYPDLQLDVLKGKSFLIYLDDPTALTTAKVLAEIDGTEVAVYMKHRSRFFNNLERIGFSKLFRSRGIKYDRSLQGFDFDMTFNSPETWDITTEKEIVSYLDFPSNKKTNRSFLLSFSGMGENAMIFYPINRYGKNIYSHFMTCFFCGVRDKKSWRRIIRRITDVENQTESDLSFRLPLIKYDREYFINEILKEAISYFQDENQIPRQGVGKINIIPHGTNEAETIYFTIPYEDYTGHNNKTNPFETLCPLIPQEIKYPIPAIPSDISSSTLINKHVGIIESINIEPPSSGNLPFYYVNAQTRDTSLYTGRESVNIGAGCSYIQEVARRSAIGEALERYCASFIFREDPIPVEERAYTSCQYFQHGSFDSFCEPECCPEDFSLFSDTQYGKPGFPYTPFDQKTKITWVPGKRLQGDIIEIDYRNSLYNRAKKWDAILPAPLVFLPYNSQRYSDFHPSCKDEPEISFYSSVGLGCGESLEEAILAGLYEVIERHSLALFWVRKDVRPEVDIRYIKQKLRERKIDSILDPSADYRILNLTGDFNIPIFYGFTIENRDGRKLFASGSACRVDPVDALVKTISEISHNRIYLRKTLSKNKDYSHMYDWNNIRSYKDHALFYNLFPEMFSYLDFMYRGGIDKDILDKVLVKNDDDIYVSKKEKARRMLLHINRIMENRGKQIYYSILTTKDVEMTGNHVVRVLIPGFIYPSPIYGQEFLGCPDLYSTGLREDELNPLPHPFA
ncbi:MAG: YcaO-like family protein [Candidatus Eremiobacteraeota bacterium]|nr:YcaO-like family protein [Candidatus Eremiobacteraeota bacterium]